MSASNYRYNLDMRKRDHAHFIRVIFTALADIKKKFGLPHPDEVQSVTTLFYYTIQNDRIPEAAKLGERRLMWEKCVKQARERYREYYSTTTTLTNKESHQ